MPKSYLTPLCVRVGTDGVHIKPRMEGGERGTGTSDILKGKWKEAGNDRERERESVMGMTVAFSDSRPTLYVVD